MYKFGRRSKRNLATVNHRIRSVLEEVIRYTDFKVLCGSRGRDDQEEAKHQGRSNVGWPFSSHNVPKLPVHVTQKDLLDLRRVFVSQNRTLKAEAQEVERLGLLLGIAIARLHPAVIDKAAVRFDVVALMMGWDEDPDGSSDAADIAPHPMDWDDEPQFAFLQGQVLGEGRRQGVRLRWGGDWDMDGQGVWRDPDERFNDMPHIEVVD